MKKVTKLFLCLILLMVSSIFFDGCSCAADYSVKVNFIEVPEEIKVESYLKEVDFQGSHKIEFEIPEGYEETDIVISVDGNEVDFGVKYLDASNREISETSMDIDFKEHLYSVKKKITYEVTDVKRRVTVDIDLTNLHKKYFDVSLPSHVSSDFQIVTLIPEEATRLMTLGNANTVKKVAFADGKAQVSYGDCVALVYTQSISSREYSKLYTLKGYFSDPNKVKVMNNTEYLEFPVAKRGNNFYRYNGDTSTRIFYYGVVKEDVNLSFSIPNFTSDSRLRVGDKYNTFYLLSNLQKYNSELISIQTFVKNSNASYSVNNSGVDKIGSTVISKVTPNETYNIKYDVNKIYLGDNLVIDPLLEEKDKENLYNEIYFQITSELDIKNINIRILFNEKVFYEKYTTLETIVSAKNKYYVKISKDVLAKYYDKFEYEDIAGNVFEYYNGSAILYVGIDKGYVNVEKSKSTFEYSQFSLYTEASGLSTGSYSGILHFVAYVKDEYGNKDYGYMDYHIHPTVPQILYLKTSKLFENSGTYKNTLYLDVYGEVYKGYTTTRLVSMTITWGVGNSLTPKEPLKVLDPKVYNGFQGFNVYEGNPDKPIIEKYQLDEYTITATVLFQDVVKKNYDVDFSNLELPDNIGEGIYVTNNYNISSLSDFTFINSVYKESNDLGINFGYNRELYYVITSKNLANFEIDVYLDSDKEKLISYDDVLYDIAGNVVTITVDGAPFVVRYKYMSTSYEVPDGDKYHLCSN